VITCFGEPLLDLFALPVGSSFEHAESFKPCPGGAPANVAVILARYGVPVRFIGAVGSGALGDRMVRELSSAGVDVRGIARSPLKAGTVFIQVTHEGEREFLGYADAGSEYDYRVENYRALQPDPLQDAEWLVAGSGSLPREPIVSALRYVVSHAQEHGVPLYVDLNVRPGTWWSRDAMLERVSWLARQATVLKASADDLCAMGLPPKLETLQELAPQAVKLLSVGAQGALALVDGVELRQPAPDERVVDTTGAGDAFTAGVLTFLYRNRIHPRANPAVLGDRRVWNTALVAGCRFGARAITTLGATEAFRQPDQTLCPTEWD
jgi:sugar/nucleoside kinase (ribokinase family)